MRVVIAEDQVLLREGLARLFVDGGHEVVDIRMPPTYTDEGVLAARTIKDRVLEVEEFLATASRAAAGGSALDPAVVQTLVNVTSGSPLDTLTERERSVLELMAEGMTNTGIAHHLVLSERTVEAHVRHVLLKLEIPESGEGNRRVLAVLAHLRRVHHWS